MDLNICIVHYNSSDTIHCLESLAFQTKKVRVLLVNNASTDHSMEPVREFAEQTKMQIEILDAPVNGGFAAGNNIALKWAHAHTPQSWNLLLNNDTKVPEDFVEKITEVAEEQVKAGHCPFALSTTEYDFSFTRMRHTGMQYLSIPTGLCCTSAGPLRTPYLCGACILIDPQAPLMDEGYFLYYEDTDYSQRLRKAGYQLLTTDRTHYYHRRGGSTSQNTHIITIQMQSMWRYYQLYYPQWIKIVKWLRKAENLIRGRMNIVRILDQTYEDAYAEK